jgi:hypothetical protein
MRLTEDRKQNAANMRYGQGRRMYSALSILFFLSGIFGMLMAVGTVDGVEYEKRLVYSTAAALCIVLWLLARLARPVLPWVLDIVVLADGYFILSDVVNIAEELRSIGYNASNMHEEALKHAEDVTKVMLLFTIALVVLLFAFEFVLESHIVSVVLTTALLVLAPVLGVKLSLLNLLLFAVFLFCLMAMHVTGRGRGRSLTEERRVGLSGYIGLVTAIVTSLAFLAAVPITSRYKEQLYEFVFQAEENVSSLSRSISRRLNLGRNSGYINRGNNYRSDAPVIHLDFDKLPEDAVYLKTFAGDGYDSRQWTASDEMAFYRGVAAVMADGSMTEEEAAAAAWTAYFMMNRVMSGFDDNIYELRIKHLRPGEAGAYRPYFALDSEKPEGVDESYSVSEMGRLTLAGTLPPEPSDEELSALDLYRRINTVSLDTAKQMYTSVTAPLPRLRELVADNPLQTVEEITAFIIYTLHSTCKYTTTPGHAPMNADIAEYFLFESKRGYCQQFAAVATLMYRLYGVPARYATGYRVQLQDVRLNEGGGFGMDVSDAFSHAWPEIFLDGYGWTPIEVTPGANGEVLARYPGISTERLMSLMDEHGWRLAIEADGDGGDGGTGNEAETLDGQAEDETGNADGQDPEEALDMPETDAGEMNPDETGPDGAALGETVTAAVPPPDGGADGSDTTLEGETGPDGNRQAPADDPGRDPTNPDFSEGDGGTEKSGSGWKGLIDSFLSFLWTMLKILLRLAALAAVLAAAAFGILRFRRYRIRTLQAMDARTCGASYMSLLHFCGLLKEYEGVEPDFARRLEEAMESVGEDKAGTWAEEMSKRLTAAAFGPVGDHGGAEGGSTGQSDHAAEGMRVIYFHTLKKLSNNAGPLKRIWLWLYYGA